MRKEQDYKITRSEEYKKYMKALCKLAAGYVPRIRAQFAAKAYEKYQDETTRKIVLAYGEEAEKHEAYLLTHFIWESEKETPSEGMLENDILNHAKAYAATIKMLFEIN